MSFPRYPAYKDSGVEWLGEVPTHWGVCALKRITSLQSGETINSNSIEDIGQYPVYGGNGFRGYTDSFTHDGFFPLIGRQGALCGNVNYAKDKFWASEHAIVASPKDNISPKWLGEILRSMNLNQYSVSAAQPGLSVEAISNLFISLPPLPEQHTIAAFLDRETAKIDALVAEQEALIALLAEKRQATISHAVTKGLTPAVPIKDSGIEWLGAVPEHWDVCSLKRIAQLQSGETITSDNIEENGLYPVYGGNGLRGYTNSFTHAGHYPLIGRQGALCGNINYAFEKFWASEHAIVVTPLRKISVFWIGELLRAMNLNQYSISAAQPGLSVEIISNLLVPLPPLAEQQAIVAHLDRETARLDALTAEARRAIDLLKERRSALISAAVTGKIDVRGRGA